MLSRITQKLISVGVIAALLIMTMQAALGAPAQSQLKPSDFFWEEVAVGTVGAILALSPIAWREYNCPVGVVDFVFASQLCGYSTSTGWVTGAIGGLAAIPLGTSIAIIANGARHGFQGNVPSTILFAYVGTLAGIGLSSAICYLLWGNDCFNRPIARFLFVPTWLAVTSVVSVLNYNHEAKLESQVKPTSIPPLTIFSYMINF